MKNDVAETRACECLALSQWWEKLLPAQVVLIQLVARKMILPFDVFHKLTEQILERPVFTHEFGLDWFGLINEVLDKDSK